MHNKFVLLLTITSSIFTALAMEFNGAKNLTKEELTSELILREKQERMQTVHCYVAFLDAYLNRDLQAKKDEFTFPDYDNPSLTLTLKLQDGFDFFKIAIGASDTKRSKISNLSEANAVVSLLFASMFQKRNFLQTIKKLEHKIAVLQNLDEEDKLELNRERCAAFSLMKRLTEEEKRETQKEMQEDINKFHEIADIFNVSDPALFLDHCDKVVGIKEALLSEDVSQLNGYKRPTSQKVITINDFIINLINEIKKMIAFRDSKLYGIENKDEKRPIVSTKQTDDECCIS